MVPYLWCYFKIKLNYKDEILTSQLVIMLQINNSIELNLFPTVFPVKCQTHLVSSETLGNLFLQVTVQFLCILILSTDSTQICFFFFKVVPFTRSALGAWKLLWPVLWPWNFYKQHHAFISTFCYFYSNQLDLFISLLDLWQ